MYAEAAVPDKHLTARDCSELNALSRVVGWDADYAQYHPGDLESTFVFEPCESLRITAHSFNQPLIAMGTPPPGHVAILLPQSGDKAGIFQGESLEPGQLAIMCPGAEGVYSTSPRHRFTTVCVPASRLRPAAEANDDGTLESLISRNRSIAVPTGNLMHLSQLIREALRLSTEDGVWRAPGALLEIEQQLVSSMVLALCEDSEKPLRAVNSRLQVFSRARAYIEENLARPLGLETIALEAGVSLRTLRNSFQQVLGFSPLQYIKVCRLTAARRQLMRAHPGSSRVIDIAMACGFSHMSYFARDYRALFGELPAQTLCKTAYLGNSRKKENCRSH